MIDVTMDLLSEIDAIAREASAAIMEVYAKDFFVQEKEDKSPVDRSRCCGA